MKELLFILSVFLIFQKASALKCYTCSIGEDDIDTTCVTDPANAPGQPIYDCNKKYCTIIRQELKDPRGQIRSFSRDCVDVPDYMDEVIEDATYRTYYKACKTDLCNSGSGIGDDGNSTGSLGDKSTIICPGIGSSSAMYTVTSILLLVLVLTNVFV